MTKSLITGASSGIGLELALAALRRSHNVIGATRSPSKASAACPEFEKLGGAWLALNISDAATESIVKSVVEKEDTDVLVNSAAFALPRTHRADQKQTSTAPSAPSAARSPTFRTRQSGTIVNVTSGAGFVGNPSRGLYAGSKFAVEGMSEALSKEMEPFNVRVVIAEPGAFRTNFLDTLVLPAVGMGGYKGTPADLVVQMTLAMKGAKLGNVRRAGETLLDVIVGEGLAAGEEMRKCLRVPLGQDCWPLAVKEAESWRQEMDITKSVSMSIGKED